MSQREEQGFFVIVGLYLGDTSEQLPTAIPTVALPTVENTLQVYAYADDIAYLHTPRHASSEAASSESSLTPEDYAVATAAFQMHIEGLRFDWEQMSERQQDIYHGLVGRWLLEMQDVD